MRIEKLLLVQIVLLVIIAIKLTDYLPELVEIFTNFSYNGKSWVLILVSVLGSVLGAIVSLIMFSRIYKITKNKKPMVYISYSNKDKELVNKVTQKLDGLDIRVIDDINIGEIIEDSLDKIIKDSDFVIILYTENFADSEWCRYELNKIFESGKRIFPLVDEDFLNEENTIDEIKDITSNFKKVKYLAVDRNNINKTMDLLVMALNETYKSMYEKAFKKY